ncbi:mucin-5AC [Calliphora vicina]|uniref:mucin-5AC n=1 Tax=Calliphora vicina TaxID=7373 RepID=UPI00325BB607
MNKIIPLVVTLIWISSGVKAGFIGSQLGYNAGFSSSVPFAGEHHYGSPYAAPSPVAPLRPHHPYANVGYSTPSVVRFRSSSGGGFGPFTSYASVRSHHKFAFSAPVPSFYNAPAPVHSLYNAPAPVPSFYNTPAPVNSFYNAPAPVSSFYNAAAPVAYGPPAVTYNSFPAPNTVIKFGPPITTTTTTYSTTAAAAASVPVANPLNAVAEELTAREVLNVKDICATLSLILATVQAGQTNLFSEYSITPSNQVAYYHYPAPPKSQQFHDPSAKTLSSLPIPTIAPAATQQGAAQTYQNQYQYHGNTQPQQQYASNYRSATAITKQFTSPALDNAAFNLALSNQGYTLGGNTAAASSSRSSKTSAASTASAAPSSSGPSASLPPLTSLNVKLPLPIGITPLNIAPLPLQAGAPYTSIPNSVTSYGTTYPQRKRR